MASTSVYIPNMLEAVRSGVLPGAFSKDRSAFEFPTLAYLGARGATHYWTARVRLLDQDTGEYAPIEDEMLDQPAPDLPANLVAEVSVEGRQKGGKVRDVVPTYVSRGKNLGKKNATNALTQALRDALGLYNKQRKRADIVEAEPEDEAEAEDEDGAEAVAAAAARPDVGDGAEEADREIAEFDSMPPPMLVKRIGDSREATLTPADYQDGITAQRKFDGVRFVVFARTGAGGRKSLVRYSRSGAEYPGQEQVAAEVLPMLERAPRIRPGEYGTPAAPDSERNRRILAAYGALPDAPGDPAPYLDGELYLHGKHLNWISGQARRGDDQGLLEYHVFDAFFPYAKAAGHDMESRHRQAYLSALFAAADAAGLRHPHVVRVENFPARSDDELHDLARRFVRERFEGAIARKDRAGYRYSYSGYHASQVVKLKPRPDAEFPVVGYTQGTRGKDVGAVIWECEVPKPVDPRDRTFAVVPNMPLADRKRLFACLGQEVAGPGGERMSRFVRDFEGKPLTVEYSVLSVKTGKPLQPKAVAFRTYEGGPELDPVRKALAECLGPSKR